MSAVHPFNRIGCSPTRWSIAPTAQLLSFLSCVSWLLLWPGVAAGSPSSALREYKAGQYDQALKEYERLFQKKMDDPRLHFNAGAAAYRNRQFDEAAKQFNATLASPDLKLQGLAYYNEGNALYHLGEGAPDPKKRTDSWEKALEDYQSTLKLNPKDADARFNYDLVKKRLEELKQQQQQNQQNKQDQNQNQDQQQQQRQAQNQPKQDQQRQQDQQQQQQNQKQESAPPQQAEQQKKQEEQQQSAKEAEQRKQVQQQATQPKNKGEEQEQQAAPAQAPAQMTPEQAKQLLDAQKADEQMLPPQASEKPADRSRPLKDW